MRSLVIGKIKCFQYRLAKFLGESGKPMFVNLDRDFTILFEGLVRFGREAVQDFVTRSRDIGDTMRYMRAEQCLEIVRLTSFVTTNLVDFERKDLFSMGQMGCKNR